MTVNDSRPLAPGSPGQAFSPGLEVLLTRAPERPLPEVEEERPLIRDDELRYRLLELRDG